MQSNRTRRVDLEMRSHAIEKATDCESVMEFYSGNEVNLVGFGAGDSHFRKEACHGRANFLICELLWGTGLLITLAAPLVSTCFIWGLLITGDAYRLGRGRGRSLVRIGQKGCFELHKFNMEGKYREDERPSWDERREWISVAIYARRRESVGIVSDRTAACGHRGCAEPMPPLGVPLIGFLRNLKTGFRTVTPSRILHGRSGFTEKCARLTQMTLSLECRLPRDHNPAP
jgi:hypothetical protein